MRASSHCTQEPQELCRFLWSTGQHNIVYNRFGIFQPVWAGRPMMLPSRSFRADGSGFRTSCCVWPAFSFRCCFCDVCHEYNAGVKQLMGAAAAHKYEQSKQFWYLFFHGIWFLFLKSLKSNTSTGNVFFIPHSMQLSAFLFQWMRDSGVLHGRVNA